MPRLASLFAVAGAFVAIGTPAGCGGSAAGGAGGNGGAGGTGAASAGTNGTAGSTAGRGGTSANAGTTGAGGRGGGSAGSGAGGAAAWMLTWSDEFDGAANASPDANKWTYDIGNGSGGWGNGELEYYTNRPTNIATDGQGHLLITLRAESYMGQAYTSARIKTQGKFTQTYGRFEARLQIPRGRGVWPAFWMLGDDITTNSWPACGEIDIMENNGRDVAVNVGSLHGPGYSGGSPLTGRYTLPTGALADAFHVYAIEWEPNVVRFYVDDNLYETRRNTDVPSGARWVYDHAFFMILNVAIGGAFPGAPDATTVLPQVLTADYVRVYSR